MFSQPVLIARGLALHYAGTKPCLFPLFSFQGARPDLDSTSGECGLEFEKQLVFLTVRVHLFPFRTQKLSSPVAKILVWRRTGKIAQRQHKTAPREISGLFFHLKGFAFGMSPHPAAGQDCFLRGTRPAKKQIDSFRMYETLFEEF